MPNSVVDEGVHLDKGSRVQQEVEPLSRRLLPLCALGVHAVLSAAQLRGRLPPA
jgi:hypothetical protein